MIAKSYILANLKSLNVKYKRTTSAKDQLYFSKLAILELCGWLEESIDSIVENHASKKLKGNQNLQFIKDKIKFTYGFGYDKNFKPLMVNLVGIVVFEQIENSVDATKLALFVSTLTTLVTKRNSEAHTHLKGIAKSIDAPSVTITYFTPLYNGLIEFENALKSL